MLIVGSQSLFMVLRKLLLKHDELIVLGEI